MTEKLKIAIICAGSGQGLLAAEAFGRVYPVIMLNQDIPGKEASIRPDISFSDSPGVLASAGILLVSGTKRPVYTLDRLSETCIMIGRHMKKGAVVIFEGPVYPGTTEDVCIPLLEKHSGMKAGKEFFIGFISARWHAAESPPETPKMRKVVAGQTGPVTDYLADLLAPIHEGGIFKAKSIRVAEAAQLLEMAQREVNTALINEIALSLNQHNIDTFDVLETANTKRGFVKFEPDLLNEPPSSWIMQGGWWRHHSGTGRELAQRIVKKLIQNEVVIHECRVTVLGMVRDFSNASPSGLIELIKELREYGVDIQLADAVSEEKGLECIDGHILTAEQDLKPGAAVILGVPHESYKRAGWKLFERLLFEKEGYVFDLNNVLPRIDKPEKVSLWRI